jgi:hypothetical protein
MWFLSRVIKIRHRDWHPSIRRLRN